MATLKDIRYDYNKRRQQILRDAGYDIPVDGSWGPWQEKQYRRVSEKQNKKQNKANVGVLAIPAAGIGAAELLGGLDITVPTISGTTAATALGPSLVLSGPAYAMYSGITGKLTHPSNLSETDRQAMVYAPDATRVKVPIPIRLIEEEATSEEPQSDTKSEGQASEEPASKSEAASEPTQPAPNPQDSNPKKGFRDRLADKVADRIRGKKSTKTTENTTPQQNTRDGGFWKGVGRTLWETQGNNFANGWRWRNAARAINGLFLPWELGVVRSSIPVLGKLASDQYNAGRGLFNTDNSSNNPVLQNEINRSDSLANAIKLQQIKRKNDSIEAILNGNLPQVTVPDRDIQINVDSLLQTLGQSKR